MRKLRVLARELSLDISEYLRAWWKYSFRLGYTVFSWFEYGKRLVAGVLYKQRGRFARPFVHTAMAGLAAFGVTIAPVVANSFPGVERGVVEEAIGGSEPVSIGDVALLTQRSDRVRDKVLEYEVQEGDTLSGIAEKFGISVDTVKWENNMRSVNQLKKGQILRILPVTGVLYKVGRGENIYTIAKKLGANPQAIVDFPFNSFADNETFALAVGQDLIVPDGELPDAPVSVPRSNVAQRTPDAGAVSATGRFVWPIGGVITQRFAWYHRAIDVAAPMGTPVVAADSGRVTVAGWPDNGGYGNRVVIDHENGYVTWYAHLSRVDVVAGQRVNRGDRIGLEGSTGRSTGPHLHFEIRQNGQFLNPLNYLK